MAVLRSSSATGYDVEMSEVDNPFLDYDAEIVLSN
jgi:hypothetical protein